MNYGQVIDQIRDLGFGDDDEIEEFGTIVPHAINRAITEISLKYAPIHSHMDIIQPFDDMTEEEWNANGYDESLFEYPMPDDFMKFESIPVKRQLGEGIYQRFNDFEIENENTIILSGEYIGTFRVFYIAEHIAFDEDTESDTPIPLPLKAHHLLPLLASYYVWLDDDQYKAEAYYQRFQQELQEAKAESEKPRARIRTDWGDGVWL